MKFKEILPKIINNPGFKTLEEVKTAGYRVVKERDGDRYFLVKNNDLKPLLVRLGDIADVRRGFTTGANEFFYLKPIGMTVKEVVEIAEKKPDALIPVQNAAGWAGEIEAEYLKPVIKSPRELKTIIVRVEDLTHLVFMCHKSEKELKGTKAFEYIQWGETQNYHKRPTCNARQRWWDLGIIDYQIVYPSTHNPSWAVFLNSYFYYIDKVFYGIKSEHYECLWVYLNTI